MDVLPHFRLRPIDDRVDVSLTAIPIARLNEFALGTLGGLRVPHARHDKAPHAAALFEYLTAVPRLARRRHALFRDELPHRLFRTVSPLPSLWISLADKVDQLRRVNCRHIVMRVVLDARPTAEIKHDAAVLAAAKCHIIPLRRLMQAQSCHRSLYLVDLTV